jgi:hypothetical protein
MCQLIQLRISKPGFRNGDFTLFTKIIHEEFSWSGALLMTLTFRAASAIRKAIPVLGSAAIFNVADLMTFIAVVEEIFNNEVQAIKNHSCLCSDHHTFISSQF